MNRHPLEALVEDLLRAIIRLGWLITLTTWRFRVELTLFTVIVGVHAVLARLAGLTFAGIATSVLCVAAVVDPWTRRRLQAALRGAMVRRAWTRAVTDSGVADPPPKRSRRPTSTFGPRAGRVTQVLAGDLVDVKVNRGSSVQAIEQHVDELAACLRVAEVRVTRHPTDASRASVLLVRRDPFDVTEPIPWPNATANTLSLWDPIPVGIDEHGHPHSIELVERNMLIGGEPGAGKSVALSLLVATAALDPNAKLWLLDGKRVELAAWAPAAERLIGPDLKDANEVLRELRGTMDDRYRELLARGRRKITREDGLPLHVIVVDELAFYTNKDNGKSGTMFSEQLRDLVARGRAAGFIVLAATQKPSVDVVPSSLRDLFGFRFALRCNTWQASDTILGQGWATAGADAATIPGRLRGVGFLLAEDDRPQRVRGHWLDDATVEAVASRAAANRADEWLADAGAPVPGDPGSGASVTAGSAG